MNPARFTILVLAVAAAVGLFFSACASDSDSTTVAHAGTTPFACPPQSLGEGKIASQNKNPKSEKLIVPGEPDRLLLCRYRGLNHGARSRTLARKHLVASPSVVRSIAEEFDDLRPFPKGTLSCPNDNGSRIYALFHYETEPLVVVEVSFSGCWSASNGRAGVGVPSVHLQRRLKNLVPV